MAIFFKNIPFFLLALGGLAVFILFSTGFAIIRKSGDNTEERRKGRKILAYSIYGFFIVVLAGLSFLTFNYFLGKWSLPKAISNPNNLPSSPIVANYVPPPHFLKIKNYFFNGPWPLKSNNFVSGNLLYAILCRENNKYAIIYLGKSDKTEETINLLKSKEYNCWLDNCQGKLKNLYISFYKDYSKKYTSFEADKNLNYLKKEIKLPCPEKFSKNKK